MPKKEAAPKITPNTQVFKVFLRMKMKEFFSCNNHVRTTKS